MFWRNRGVNKKKKREAEMTIIKRRALVCVCTYVRVLFDRHKQFFLQVDDGSDRLGQLQGGSVHKAIHCVAVHVLTHSVDF